MKCSKCGIEIQKGDEYSYLNQTLCEDCYIYALEPPRTCDVAAVHSAKSHRESAGQTGSEGMTDLQKKIISFVTDKGKATREEVCQEFGLTPRELEKQTAIMRHCELLKGRKIENVIYLVPFDLE